MSPNVGNFVHDLVEMAKAMEELPGVKAELIYAKQACMEKDDIIASREERILKLKAEIESLNSKVRSAEEARDQAETMFLELDEKASSVLVLFAGIKDRLGEATDILMPQKPPAPEPVVEPEVMRSSTEHQAEPHPFEDHGGGMSQPVGDPAPTSPGQSEPDPTVHTESNTAPAGSTESPVSHTDPIASTEPDPSANPSHDNDPEPTRYDQDGYTTREWWHWRNRQPSDF